MPKAAAAAQTAAAPASPGLFDGPAEAPKRDILSGVAAQTSILTTLTQESAQARNTPHAKRDRLLPRGRGGLVQLRRIERVQDRGAIVFLAKRFDGPPQ
ncbi:MAG: hypothetical protein AAGL49_12175 [Pseudomonadota bacterium]